MADPVVLLSHDGADPHWTIARVAGLPAVERNLMALGSIGVPRVRVLCGEREHAVVSRHLERRRGDPRLPDVSVSRAGASLPSDGVVVDGRAVYHPALLERMLEARERSGDGAGPSMAAEQGWYCEDITTADGRRRASRAIRRSLRKPTDGWFARHVDRSVSLAISALLAPFPVHPNAVTIGTLLVGAASAWFAARGSYAGFVTGGVLFLLASVLDGVDGELARMKFQGSALGQWLDTVCDDLTNALYLTGLTVGSYRAAGSTLVLWSGVAAVALDIVTVVFLYWQLVTAVDARTLLAFEETILGPALRRPGLAGIVARLQPFIKRDIYAPLFLAFAVAGAAWLALPATAAALAITLAFVVADFAHARHAGARVA